MIQFNLLPDIKIQYLQARRQKQFVLLGSSITIAACVTAMIIFTTVVFGLQKKNISDLSRDITTGAKELQSTKDLTKILTVQNQLRVLPDLHAGKPLASRIFGYIKQSTPTAANISRLNVDFGEQTMIISGSANNLVTVNKFADTLKFTTFHTEVAPKEEKRAFSSVVLSSFGRDNQGASFTLNFRFDPIIFSESEVVSLTVPNKITTRSQVEQPSALFKEGATE
jgi:hypothetical protein